MSTSVQRALPDFGPCDGPGTFMAVNVPRGFICNAHMTLMYNARISNCLNLNDHQHISPNNLDCKMYILLPD
jgi:hypothetical protein